MPLKTQVEVEAMLAKFDALDTDYRHGAREEGIYETLLWFLGHRDDRQLLSYIEDL